MTKVGATRDGTGAWVPGAEPADLKAQVEQNLRSLGVERIDLVNLRRFERDDPDRQEPALEDQLGALAELRDEGKIDLIGVSSVGVETVRRAIDLVGIGEVQNAFSILDRSDEAVLDLCREHGVAYVPVLPARLGLHRRPGRPGRRRARVRRRREARGDRRARSRWRGCSRSTTGCC